MWDGVENRRIPREPGHATPCPELMALRKQMDEILTEVRLTRADSKTVKTVVLATRNIEGFVAIMRNVGWFVIKFAAVLAALTVILEAVKHWLKG